MGRGWRLGSACAVALAGLGFAAPASSAGGDADPPPAPVPVDEATQRGRAAYERGKAHIKDERWNDALAAFQEAESARDAPLVQYSIGYCLRAIGRYVAARERFTAALAARDGLTPSEVEEATAYVGEIDRILVRVDVTLVPATATLMVDGRPLRAGKDRDREAMLASVEPPGEGRSPGPSRFVLVIEQGSHLFVATRPGHKEAVVQKAYRAGAVESLRLELDTLPARVTYESTPVRGIVRVDGREVGITPAEFERPAGRYRVEVVADQYEDYSTTLDLEAGQRLSQTAPLKPRPLVKRWWFWTSVLAGAAAATVGVTYAATHRTTTPDYLGGSTNWVVKPAAIRW